MADTIEESPVSYEELMDLEDEFEQAETEISEFYCVSTNSIE
jgi:hypothetical protein